MKNYELLIPYMISYAITHLTKCHTLFNIDFEIDNNLSSIQILHYSCTYSIELYYPNSNSTLFT